MGIVWEAYNKGVPSLEVPENPTDFQVREMLVSGRVFFCFFTSDCAIIFLHPKGNDILPTIHFQGREMLVSGRVTHHSKFPGCHVDFRRFILPIFKGQLDVLLTYVYPWYLLCSTLGFLGISYP